MVGGEEEMIVSVGEPLQRVVFGGAQSLQKATEATSDLIHALKKYLDVYLLPSRTFLSAGFVIRSFMLSRTIHDTVLPTGRISPWSNAYNRGIVRGHYEHVNQMGHSFNTDRSDCKAKCVDHVYEKQSHHFQHSRQSNLHLYRNDLYDDTDKNHPIHDEEDDTPAPK
ncbi:hypothetical protein T459_12185 [Capsicum annuum]|uniref:Uncharacterized protein n=1 Tax=Capsicum annuum TaxID=4072 RepID=A0A2G2ZP23_CAPAN|nr:hypothetical protein T459_12185 [Capsicum annuum]